VTHISSNIRLTIITEHLVIKIVERSQHLLTFQAKFLTHSRLPIELPGEG